MGGGVTMDEHDWARDPEHRGEGLICADCGVTEAEAEASPDASYCHADPARVLGRFRFADLSELADDENWLGI